MTLDQALQQPMTEEWAALIVRSTYRLGRMTFTIESLGGCKRGSMMRIHTQPLDISVWVTVSGNGWYNSPGWGNAVMEMDVIDLLGTV